MTSRLSRSVSQKPTTARIVSIFLRASVHSQYHRRIAERITQRIAELVDEFVGDIHPLAVKREVRDSSSDVLFSIRFRGMRENGNFLRIPSGRDEREIEESESW
ncbi:hypothetical protein CDAR_320841 [Caerostris darwini]|uniref:Uncharacterized protein n=1 Tax=Caerostris darwini TaxID=1538125 RepID=A0AAV4X0C2_9ARAC|nr:hypothetical protein CDAR_320841 [Caerostris darwini]